MSVSIITFANLGRKTNIPTVDILPVIERFAKEKDLEQVICQINTGFDSKFKNTTSAVPAIIRYGIRVGEKILGESLSRSCVETLFDYFAQMKLVRAKAVLFHGGYFLSRTLARAHRNDSIAIDLTRTAHFAVNIELEKEELTKLGFPEYTGTFARLGRGSEHHNNFDYIIALSDFVKQTYVERGFPENRVFVASPDVDARRFTPQSINAANDSVFKVVYTAYTTPLKGLHYLLDAWEQLKLPDAELVLVGEYGDMPDALKKRYDETISRNPNTKWMGSTQTPENYYRNASAFVFPSLTEGFGRVTLEAMACGLPVITTENAKGIVEDGKTGFVVPIRDANALKEKMEYLYNHRDVARQMGREARKAVEQKKPFGEAVYEIYQEILRREGRA